MSRIRIGIVAFLTFAALAAVMPAAALAAKPHVVSRTATASVFGSLASFDATTAVITTPGGPVDINLTAATDYRPNNQTAAVAGFKVGDQVLARGTFRNGFRTDWIRYDVVPFVVSGLNKFDGRLQLPAVSPNTLTILIRKGVARTFYTDSNTLYYHGGRLIMYPGRFLQENVALTIRALEYSNSTGLPNRS